MTDGAWGLILVDLQNDFCEGGSLAVAGGEAVVRAVSKYLADHADDYEVVIASRDWHIDPGGHFSDAPDFAVSWPRHCVVGTAGAEFHPDLDTSRIDLVVDKGQHAAAYSGFEGRADDATLDEVLRSRGVAGVDVCGLATDYCVRATALDAAGRGLRVRLLQDLSAGVDPATTSAALAELAAHGVELA